MAYAARCGRRSGWLEALLGAVIAISSPLASAMAAEPVEAAAPAAGQPVIVYIDQARLLRLPERTATLVIGNPLIADAAVQPGGVLVITGKSYGVTNLVALDRNGVTLMDHPIQVQGARDNIVVVYRGIERESYSCTPNCERRITLGDSAAYFTTTLGQSGNFSATAAGGQASKN
jgi:hypothetical protein